MSAGAVVGRQIIIDFVGPCKLYELFFLTLKEISSDFAGFAHRHDIFHLGKRSGCYVI